MYFLFQSAPPSVLCVTAAWCRLHRRGTTPDLILRQRRSNAGSVRAMAAAVGSSVPIVKRQYRVAAQVRVGSSCRLASGNAVLHWLLDFDCQPDSPCTLTLPGMTQPRRLLLSAIQVLCWIDCSGKTRLALHVPSSHELESVNIIIIIMLVTPWYPSW